MKLILWALAQRKVHLPGLLYLRPQGSEGQSQAGLALKYCQQWVLFHSPMQGAHKASHRNQHKHILAPYKCDQHRQHRPVPLLWLKNTLIEVYTDPNFFVSRTHLQISGILPHMPSLFIPLRRSLSLYPANGSDLGSFWVPALTCWLVQLKVWQKEWQMHAFKHTQRTEGSQQFTQNIFRNGF